jgi:hypothetical protein
MSLTTLPTALVVASPSLVGAEEPNATAYELKFLLDEARAAELEARARARLALDPHGEAALGGAYRITTLYCDTPALHMYWRSPSYRRRKFRVRRYGAEETAYLERKTRKADRVAKKRQLAALGELPLLGREPGADWPCGWFHRQLAARDLRPVALVAYERVALIGQGADGALRLTFDRRLRGVRWQEWSVPGVERGAAFLEGRVIVEMKFRTALPGLFQELMARFRLQPTAASKYRQCIDACGAPARDAGPV